jgi:predicted DNA-binding transcriptional regulator AlpA
MTNNETSPSPLNERRVVSASKITPLDRLISFEEVCQLTSYSRAQLYRKIGDKSFPPPKKLGRSRVGFPESEVRAWLRNLPRATIKAA